MSEVKGVVLEAWMTFLRDRCGEQAVSAAHESLDPAERLLLRGPFLASSWYPFETLHSIRSLVRDLAIDAGPEFGVQVGRFMARHAYGSVYRSLLADDPLTQAERFSWIDDLFFRGVRKLESEVTGPSACVARYRYEPGVRPARGMCASLIGFWIQMLEMSGAANVRGSHPKCLSNKSNLCEFAFEWDSPAAKV